LTPEGIAKTLAEWSGGAGEGWPSWAFSNHDAPRALSRWTAPEHRDAFARLCLLLILCLRGNPFIYYGDELGLPQAEVPFDRVQDPEAVVNWPLTLGRDGARTPMPWTAQDEFGGFSSVEPWLPMATPHLALAVDRQDRDPGSVLNLARRLIALRKTLPALRHDDMTIITATEQLLVFERGAGSDAVLCAFNLSPTGVDCALPRGWRILEPLGAVNASGSGSVQLGPYAAFLARPA